MKSCYILTNTIRITYQHTEDFRFHSETCSFHPNWGEFTIDSCWPAPIVLETLLGRIGTMDSFRALDDDAYEPEHQKLIRAEREL